MANVVCAVARTFLKQLFADWCNLMKNRVGGAECKGVQHGSCSVYLPVCRAVFGGCFAKGRLLASKRLLFTASKVTFCSVKGNLL